MKLGSLLCLCCAVAGLPAQPPAIDAHLVRVADVDGTEIPAVESVGVRRYVRDRNVFRSSGATVGSMEGLQSLELESTERGPLSVSISYRRNQWTMGISTPSPQSGHGVFGPFSGLHQTGEQVFLLLVPVDDESAAPPKLWSGEAYAEYMVLRLLRISDLPRGETHESRFNLLRALGCMPLAVLLAASDLARLHDHLRESSPSRPRHRPVEIMQDGVDENDAAEIVAIVSLDPDALHQALTGSQSFSLRRALILAFTQLEEPVQRGRVAWALVDPDPAPYRTLALVPTVHELLEEGKIILPGTEEQQRRRREQIGTLAAETRAGPPLLMLGIGAAGLALLTLGTRRLTGRIIAG